jgi:hypothetical protein
MEAVADEVVHLVDVDRAGEQRGKQPTCRIVRRAADEGRDAVRIDAPAAAQDLRHLALRDELLEERFVSAAWDDLAPMVRHFLAGAGEASGTPPAAACFAVAGPVEGGQAQLTNLPWRLETGRLASSCGLSQLELSTISPC